MTENERFKKAISAIKFRENSTQKAISEALGYKNQSYISDVTNGRFPVSPDIIEKLSEVYTYISKDWLLTGEGSMLNEPPEQEAKAITGGYFVKRVPVVPYAARAGYAGGWNDPDFIDELDTLPVIVDREWHGNYMIFEVSGDSMDDGSSDALINRDFVLCREIQRHLWQDSKIHYKQWKAFVIVTRDDGIVVKQIIGHDVENHTISLHSLNDYYKDYTIDLADVKQIFNVVQLISRQL